ncbi:ubiquitin-associated and SH3 domain-containing protein A [Pyxicephalus adspersus]|uniref:ubiquitin-associated and SH3 domain-containing protein A n=1 Tax=Pyxicephalus adspersus TaxID=30357 RepID=UPI003B5B1217
MRIKHQARIRVDRRLCDWMENSNPAHFMCTEELQWGGYNMDLDYRPPPLPEELQSPKESAVQFLQSVRHHSGGGVTIIVGPSSSLFPLSRIILGFPPQQSERSMKVPPLTSCLCEEVSEGQWAMMEPLLKNLTHSSSRPVPWDNLLK